MINDKIAALKAAVSDGVSPAMATPVVPGAYTVNLPVVPTLVDFLIDAGVAGIFAGGTTGEGVLFDDDQRRLLHAATVAAAHGRVPVLVHVGTQRTENAIALAQHAADIGADAVVAVTPFFYNMSDDGLLRHFSAIAAAAPDTPFFVYDIPQFAVNGISPALLGRLAREIPSLAGMKSSRVDVQIMRQLADAMPADRILLAGNESAALGLLALGSHGLISGLSTAVPEPFVELTRAYAAGEMEAARRWQQAVNRMLAVIPANARLGAIKRVLEERGIEVGPPVPTLQETGEELWPKMRAILDAVRQPA